MHSMNKLINLYSYWQEIIRMGIKLVTPYTGQNRDQDEMEILEAGGSIQEQINMKESD